MNALYCKTMDWDVERFCKELKARNVGGGGATWKGEHTTHYLPSQRFTPDYLTTLVFPMPAPVLFPGKVAEKRPHVWCGIGSAPSILLAISSIRV